MPPLSHPTVQRFKHLTETLLPALAREHHWPVRLDHCFKRICLDHAFADVWYHHLPRPAERHLTGPPLARAIACAESIVAQGLPTLTLRNTESLHLRGKIPAAPHPWPNLTLTPRTLTTAEQTNPTTGSLAQTNRRTAPRKSRG